MGTLNECSKDWMSWPSVVATYKINIFNGHGMFLFQELQNESKEERCEKIG